MSDTKKCSKCGEEKPATVEYFGRDKNRSDGFYPTCKACRRMHREANKEELNARVRRALEARSDTEKKKRAEYQHLWYETNKKRIRERAKEYYQANKERTAAYWRSWYEANREQHKDSSRKYYHENRERAALNLKRYRASNPALVRSWKMKRRAFKHNAGGSHSAADVQAQYKAQKGKCYYCQAKVGDNYHVDHVIPLSRGGSNGPENIVVACPTCNQSKSDKFPHEWPQGGRLL